MKDWIKARNIARKAGLVCETTHENAPIDACRCGPCCAFRSVQNAIVAALERERRRIVPPPPKFDPVADHKLDGGPVESPKDINLSS